MSAKHAVKLTFLLKKTWKTSIITPCREFKMAKRYLKIIVSRLKTSNPKTHVNPSNGSSTAEPLRPTFTFLNISSAEAFLVVVLSFKVFDLEFAAT